ncbi:MAG TPA: Flp family type IVb pilin [Blastocatellia bacterium]|nr:Flp family type IVb pilin [Blastocatellia bacterium]
MFRNFLRDERGQDFVEYSLLLVLIGAVAIITMTAMGTSISSIFSKIAGRLSQVEGSIS